jgi:hypothetical protein
MSTPTRRSAVAACGAIILLVALTGSALGARPGSAPAEVSGLAGQAPLAADGAAPFVDSDGDGVSDSCDSASVADPDAAAAAEAAVDLDGDGAISVSEAAHSDRTDGDRCNHGGYVSAVAHAVDADEEDADDADDQEATACDPVDPAAFDPAVFHGPGAFGAYVSSVARSDVIGGKNCNHGGAVSEAVKAAKDTAKAERDAAKAERKAAREARTSERAAAKAAKGAGGQ